MMKNITLAVLGWENHYLSDAYGPYEDGSDGLSPDNNIPLAIKLTENLTVDKLSRFIRNGGTSNGNYSVRASDHVEPNLVIFHREKHDQYSSKWGTDNYIGLVMNPDPFFMRNAIDTTFEACIKDHVLLSHIISHMAPNVSTLQELSRPETYRQNPETIRRAFWAYSKQLNTIARSAINPIIHVNTDEQTRVPYLDEIKQHGGDSQAIVGRVINHISELLFDEIASRVVALEDNFILYRALAQYAPTWIKENANEASDDQIITAWVEPHKLKGGIVRFNVAPSEALSALDELPEHLSAHYKSLVSHPLSSDISLFTRSLVKEYTGQNVPGDLDDVFDEILSNNKESLHESGVITINKDWFMDEIGVNEGIFGYAKNYWKLLLDDVEPVNGVNNRDLERALRRIRIQQVPTPELLERCLDEATQLNMENFVEYFGTDFANALSEHNIDPRNVRDIRWI